MSLAVADRLLADVAARFNAKVRGGKFRAKCPAHADNAPSLVGQLGEYGDRVVLHCFAGCVVEDVLAAVGLSVKDLFRRSGGGPERPASVLVAAKAFRADKGEWRRSVLAAKLPAVAGDLFALPEIVALFPTSTEASRRAQLWRLARDLGVVPAKLGGGRSGWLWSLETACSLEGNTSAPETPRSLEGNTFPDDGGRNVALLPSTVSRTFGEGNTSPPVRYENVSVVERSEDEIEREAENVRANVEPCPTMTVFEADAEGQAALGEVLEMFGGRVVGIRPDDGGQRAEDLELRRAAGCSACGDWRTGALYVGGLCSRCFKAAPSPQRWRPKNEAVGAVAR